MTRRSIINTTAVLDLKYLDQLASQNGSVTKHAERNLQKVLVVDTKTPAPHSQEKGVYDIEMEHSGTVAHTTGNGASDHINTDSLPNNYTDFGAAEAGALVGALLHNGDALLHDGSAFLVQEAGCASLREVHDSPALEGHFGGSLDIDGKDRHTEGEAEELQGTCPEQPGVIHHEQDRRMVMMWKKLSKEQKQNADKIEQDLGRYRILREKREAEIAEAENRRKKNESVASRENFAEEYADKASTE